MRAEEYKGTLGKCNERREQLGEHNEAKGPLLVL